MTSTSCPACQHPEPVLLIETSKDSRVNYYRCPNCTHVWTVDRETGEILHHVTVVTASLGHG